MPYTYYLPQVYGNAAIAGQGDACGMNERASQFAAAWMTLLGDRARQMTCDSRLCQCAQDHAQYLASRTGEQLLQSMHRGRNGSYSNQRVLESGYNLPDYYKPDANNVESCARSWETPQHAAQSLAEHDTHREHMLGLNWYADHLAYGVGNADTYYVALTAPIAL